MGETNLGHAADAGPEPDAPWWAARKLLRAARRGTLATATEGQPFASLCTPATAADGSVLLLLSELSEHTRQLRGDGRCSVLVVGEAERENPQTAPRLTLTGIAEPDPDPALKARWVAVHPYAAFYAGFGDFGVWRMRVMGGLFIGGFASAHRLKRAELAAEAVLAESEAEIIAHCNADHPDAMDLIANDHGMPGSGWRMVACDADGFDVVCGDATGRVAFRRPVQDSGGVRRGLVLLAGAARSRAITTGGQD